MTTKDFINKWNVAYEDTEQQLEFAAEMEADLKDVMNEILSNANSRLKIYHDLTKQIIPNLSMESQETVSDFNRDTAKYLGISTSQTP